MLTNEIIRELKANRTEGRLMCFMSKEAQAFLSSNRDRILESWRSNEWESGYLGNSPDVVYSLPPDYPELPPPVVEGWVEVPVDNKGMIRYVQSVTRWTSHLWLLGELLPHFGGYRWSDDRLTLTARGVDDRGSLSVALKRWVKPATPVALRFWCTDVQKFKQAQTRS